MFRSTKFTIIMVYNVILNQFYQFYLGSRDVQFHDILQHQNFDLITIYIYMCVCVCVFLICTLDIKVCALMMVNMVDRNM